MTIRNSHRTLATGLALALAATPLGAFAQTRTSETVHGTIASYDGGSTLSLNDDRGYVDAIRVDRGTSINAGGQSLQPGMRVTIVGVNAGDALSATEIDLDDAPQAAGPPTLRPDRGAPQPPPPGVAPAPHDVHARAVSGVLESGLDSGSAQVGQSVRLLDVSSPDGRIAHATAIGEVASVTPAGQGRTAQVELHFRTLRFADGSHIPIDGVVEHMDVRTKSNAAKEAGGALAGMLVGNAIVKSLFGAGGGGIIGAVGGFLIAKDNRSNVVIPAQSTVTLNLLPPRRQAQ